MILSDTIVAVATPPGRGGLGVVRLSGERAAGIARGMLRVRNSFEDRVAVVAELMDEGDEVVDSVVATWFRGPRSYTAEDVVEIACHGAPVVLQFCVERAVRLGARPAEPGEFTLRAYLNGRLDLPRAEAVRDLIEATTLYQAKIATQQIDGSVSRRIAPLKEHLLELISLMEAGIDFAEDDIDVAPPEELLRRIGVVRDGLDRLVRSFAYGKLVHNGFTMAIVGRPNVGKSSLFNRLLEQDRAIVTDIPGTTRDTVSEVAAIGGIPVRFVDTAGIREGQDRVEQLGIERSYQALADADLVVVVLDASAGVTAEDRTLLEKAGPGALVVANKADCAVADNLPEGALRVSALTGEGVEDLRARLLEAVSPGSGPERESGFITSVRHESLLREAVESLDRAANAVRFGIPHEMVMLDLYATLQPVDAITGATTADDILNRIFATFCIGK